MTGPPVSETTTPPPPGSLDARTGLPFKPDTVDDLRTKADQANGRVEQCQSTVDDHKRMLAEAKARLATFKVDVAEAWADVDQLGDVSDERSEGALASRRFVRLRWVEAVSGFEAQLATIATIERELPIVKAQLATARSEAASLAADPRLKQH